MTITDPIPGQDGPSLSLESLRSLLEAVWRVQDAVARRPAMSDLFQLIVDDAAALLRVEIACLRLVDREDPSWMRAVAALESADLGERWRLRSPVSEGISGRVIVTGELIAVRDHQRAPTGSRLLPDDAHAVMGVPVTEGEATVGCLVVASMQPGREWTATEQELARQYCRHVSAALATARATDAIARAFSDPLTGLANRALLFDRLEHQLVRAHREGRCVSVLVLDLDSFKAVNDTLGHAVGDELLIDVAQRLRGCLREADTCARLGGDEFAIVLGDATDPAPVAGRIIEALRTPFAIAGHELVVGASLGSATGDTSPAELLREADLAMYHAKHHRAGSYAHHQPDMQPALLDLTPTR